MVLQSALFLAFPAFLAVSGIYDLFTMTIPNWLCGLIVAFFFAAALALGMPLAAVAMALAAGALVLAIGFACFAFGWMGGGDAKLAAAAAMWLGFGQMLPFLCYAAVLGGALTLLILAFRSRLLPAFALKQEWLTRLHDKTVGVPYGVALAAAAMIVFPSTPFLQLMLA